MNLTLREKEEMNLYKILIYKGKAMQPREVDWPLAQFKCRRQQQETEDVTNACSAVEGLHHCEAEMPMVGEDDHFIDNFWHSNHTVNNY